MASPSKDLDDARAALAAGDLARGERLARRVLAASPGNARAHELMAFVSAGRGDEAGSLEHLRKASRSPEASAACLYQLGATLRRAGNDAEARRAFEDAIARDARFFPAHHDLGVLLHETGKPDESLPHLDRAITIAPDSFEALLNRGRALQALGRSEEALASFDRAMALRPDHPAVWSNRGETLDQLRRHREALAHYRKAIELHPAYDDARWNASLALLLLGEFKEGWELYECRWSGALARARRHAGTPWRGEDVRGKRLLVWWEQGFGDTLHFCRYLPQLADRGAQVTFEAQRPLAALMTSVDPRIRVVPSGDPVGDFDLQIPLLSLPLAFGTTADTIPARVPYLFAQPQAVAAWRDRLGPRTRPRIAVAVAGHAAQKDNAARSMSLEALAPLAREADLFVVQVGIAEADRAYAARAASRVQILEGDLRDFSDSAAVLEQMDAVVTVDSALAHLAGSLAKPVWIMLPWTPTWRWMVDRQDSPWYPTARLVRQSERGRWDDVIGRVHACLRDTGVLRGAG